jgi:hypothetical protein
MVDSEILIPRIVYLFGAGATHAEVAAIEIETDEMKVGLGMGNVTKRVMLETQKENFFDCVRMFLGTEDNTNIELLISLFESNGNDIEGSTDKIVNRLKELVQNDITKMLTPERFKKFSLHKALFELHKIISDKEALHGIITLNYDTVLDEAYEEHYGYKPDYSFSSLREKSPSGEEKIPLLKLHGSFDWGSIKIAGRLRPVSIIPLGANKNYLRLPYNFIWGRALEILAECDILRVIGCSLNPNDIHLIDLLFKAHVAKGKPFQIQLINGQLEGEKIKGRYSFFPNMTTADNILIPRLPNGLRENVNFFKEWLKAYAGIVDEAKVKSTTYLKQIAL